MMDKFHIDNILKIIELKNEFELERATALHGKLRLMIKEDSSLIPVRKHLTKLIKSYEEKYWLNEENITDKQIEDSNKAEFLIDFENKFIQKRKERIQSSLKKYNLNQQDLGTLLGHRKNYMSELINGVRPFSMIDIMVIHRLLGIKFEELILPILKEEVVNRIRQAINSLDKPHLKIKKKDIENLIPM